MSYARAIASTGSFRYVALAELRRQWFRFVLVGGIVFGVYVGTTTLLAEVVGLPFEVALAIGFALAIATHFSLQRFFVWRHAAAFALPLHHQLVRYMAMAAIQYGLTATITATLPHAFGVSPEVVSTDRGSAFGHQLRRLPLADLPCGNRSAASVVGASPACLGSTGAGSGAWPHMLVTHRGRPLGGQQLAGRLPRRRHCRLPPRIANTRSRPECAPNRRLEQLGARLMNAR